MKARKNPFIDANQEKYIHFSMIALAMLYGEEGNIEGLSVDDLEQRLKKHGYKGNLGLLIKIMDVMKIDGLITAQHHYGGPYFITEHGKKNLEAHLSFMDALKPLMEK